MEYNNTTIQTEKKQNIVFELVVNFATALLIFLLFYYFVAQTHEVHGASMQPNFYTGDRVITEKVSKHFTELEHGDVVVVESPSHAEPLIKRIIAMAGETIEIRDGEVYRDGILLTEEYVRDGVNTGGQRFLREGIPYTVPEGEYLFMGDNRNVSSDSRTWGSLPKDKIVGKVVFRYWPLDRIGLIAE